MKNPFVCILSIAVDEDACPVPFLLGGPVPSGEEKGTGPFTPTV
jgi:hypothetical protein